MFITYETLRRAGACYSQRQTFREFFPNGIEVTPGLCVVHAFDFDFNWAGRALLSGDTRVCFVLSVQELYRNRTSKLVSLGCVGDLSEYLKAERDTGERFTLAVAELFGKLALKEDV